MSWLLRTSGCRQCTLRTPSVPSLSADAQKFKTKFEECRKEIEEREKKGDVVPWGDEGGCWNFFADSLCTLLQLQSGAFSVCQRNIPGCYGCLCLLGVIQLPGDMVIPWRL